MLNNSYKLLLMIMAILLVIKRRKRKRRCGRRPDTNSLLARHQYVNEIIQEMIVPNNSPGTSESLRQRRLRGIFKGAVGALDGTLVDAVVSSHKKNPYRGMCKGDCYQNVLAICDFNLVFTFIWAGWEGVSHDSRVLTETISDPTNNFPLPPPDKYCLCDAVYPHTRSSMAPIATYDIGYQIFEVSVQEQKKSYSINHMHDSRMSNVLLVC